MYIQFFFFFFSLTLCCFFFQRFSQHTEKKDFIYQIQKCFLSNSKKFRHKVVITGKIF